MAQLRLGQTRHNKRLSLKADWVGRHPYCKYQPQLRATLLTHQEGPLVPMSRLDEHSSLQEQQGWPHGTPAGLPQHVNTQLMLQNYARAYPAQDLLGGSEHALAHSLPHLASSEAAQRELAPLGAGSEVQGWEGLLLCGPHFQLHTAPAFGEEPPAHQLRSFRTTSGPVS